MSGYDIKRQTDYPSVIIGPGAWDPKPKRVRLPRKTKKRLRMCLRAAIRKQYKSMARSLVAAWQAGEFDAP